MMFTLKSSLKETATKLAMGIINRVSARADARIAEIEQWERDAGEETARAWEQAQFWGKMEAHRFFLWELRAFFQYNLLEEGMHPDWAHQLAVRFSEGENVAADLAAAMCGKV